MFVQLDYIFAESLRKDGFEIRQGLAVIKICLFIPDKMFSIDAGFGSLTVNIYIYIYICMLVELNYCAYGNFSFIETLSCAYGNFSFIETLSTSSEILTDTSSQ